LELILRVVADVGLVVHFFTVTCISSFREQENCFHHLVAKFYIIENTHPVSFLGLQIFDCPNLRLASKQFLWHVPGINSLICICRDSRMLGSQHFYQL
jgi:hypothetical protein